MALKIVKASDPIIVEHINLCLYGAPGIGKTTLAATANNPIILDFDNGVHRAGLRKDSVIINHWSEINNLTKDDLDGYDTVVIDTAGRSLDSLTIDIINKNARHGRGSGALTLQGYGELKSRFTAWLKLLNSFGKDVVLIAHMDEIHKGDEIIERLDVQGGSKNEIYKSMDVMGRIFINQQGRFLDFSPSSASYGKNPAQLEVMNVPHIDKNPNFLANIITTIKNKLNEQTEDQIKAQKEMEEWRDLVNGLNTPNDFNEMLGTVKVRSKPLQAIFNSIAESKGLIFDKTAKSYVEATA